MFQIPAMIENINKTCDELHFNGLFRYTPPPGFPQCEGSELTWYTQNGTVLSYEESLIQAFCETGIRLGIRCFDPPETHEYDFQVTNQTIPHSLLAPTNGTISENTDNGLKHLWWLFLIVPVLLVLYCVYRKRKRRPKRDAGEIPTKNITAENDEEAQALNGHAQDV